MAQVLAKLRAEVPKLIDERRATFAQTLAFSEKQAADFARSGKRLGDRAAGILNCPDVLRQRAKDFGVRAVDEILQGDAGGDVVGQAVRGAQLGRKTIDEQAARVLGAVGLATQADLGRVNRRIGKLRKRLKALVDRLDE